LCYVFRCPAGEAGFEGRVLMAVASIDCFELARPAALDAGETCNTDPADTLSRFTRLAGTLLAAQHTLYTLRRFPAGERSDAAATLAARRAGKNRVCAAVIGDRADVNQPAFNSIGV
jgi:hypothetical protein